VAPLVFYWPARGRYRDGLQWLEQTLAFTTDHPATRIQLLLGAAVLAMQLSNRPLAGQRATEALELATSMEEPRAIAWALQVIGMSRARDEADSLQQQSLFERVLEFDPEAIGPAPYHWAATMLAWLRWGAGDLRSARELVSDSVRTCRASGIPTRLADLLRVFGGIEVAMGNLQEAEQPLAEGLALSIQVGLREVEGGVLGMLARLEAARGAWDRALELVDQAASVSGGDATLGAQLEAGHQRSAILRHLGRVREANDLLARCIAGPHAGRVLWQSENEVLLGELLRLAGELSSAKAILEEAVERLSSHGHHLVAAEGRLVLARVARDERELSDAQDLVHGALTFFAEAGALLDLIDSLEVLAGVLGTLENHAEAARLFAAADTIRERVGYVRPPVEQPGYDTDVAALHEALGQGAFEAAWAEGTTLSTDDAVAYARRGRGERRRPSAGWDSLTPTEAKVVGLVAEGLSNPEIAERMFVARATVRTHLSHVFAKLGVSSRAELAAQAARRHQ
jgi:DNA-binding CsgD family transcriptional regulator/tetratricopeptide (TPR) repeat protein